MSSDSFSGFPDLSVVMRSLVEVEVKCMLSHIRLLQSSISQLLEYNKLEVFLEG